MIKRSGFVFTEDPPNIQTTHHIDWMDAVQWASGLPTEYFDCWVTSPPYFHQIDYGVNGQVGLEDNVEDYLAYQKHLAMYLRHATKPTGVLIWVVRDSYNGSGGAGGDYIDNDGNYRMKVRGAQLADYPTKAQLLIPELTRINIAWAGWLPILDVIWDKSDSFNHAADRPSYGHEHVLIFAKEHTHYWNRDAVLGESKYVKRRPGAYLRSVWKIPPGKQPKVVINGEEIAFLAAFPQLLAEICICLGCPPGGIVGDPYVGSGTTAMAAAKWGRHFIGCDLNKKFVEAVRFRLQSVVQCATHCKNDTDTETDNDTEYKKNDDADTDTEDLKSL